MLFIFYTLSDILFSFFVEVHSGIDEKYACCLTIWTGDALQMKNATNIGSSLGFRTVCKSGISRIKLRESNLPVFFVEEKPVLVGKLLAHFICWLMTTKILS